jgi:hypothetical protein
VLWTPAIKKMMGKISERNVWRPNEGRRWNALMSQMRDDDFEWDEAKCDDDE